MQCIGYRIAEEGFQGADRAEYGAGIIAKLAKELTLEYGKGFTKSNLYSFYSFYKTYPEIFQTVSGKSSVLLSWSHYAALLQVNDKDARDWYEREAINQTWSVRTLQRNISSQYYYRMLKTQKKDAVMQEMQELTSKYQNDKLEFIKNPVIAEFLGLSSSTDFTESDVLSSATREEIQYETIGEAIKDAVPGFYGYYFLNHFQPYLQGRIETPEQKEAYETICAFWDNTEIKIPVLMRLFSWISYRLNTEVSAETMASKMDAQMKLYLEPDEEQYEKLKKNVLDGYRIKRLMR